MNGWLRAATVSVLVALALAGCTHGGSDPSPTTAAGSPSATPALDAAAVLGLYGLTLPDGAQDVAVTQHELEEMTDSYLVTFTVPADEAETFARAALGPTGVVDPVPSGLLEELGLAEAPAGARLVWGSPPDEVTQRVVVLYSGDPAQVVVSVSTMPSR